MGAANHKHGKQRKPRSVASAIPEQEYDDIDSSMGSTGCSIDDSTNSFAEDSNRRSMNDNSNHKDKTLSKPLRRRQGVVKTVSSQKPDTIVESTKSKTPNFPKQAPRCGPTKKKLRPSASVDEDTDGKTTKKPSRRARSTSPHRGASASSLPSYDWSHHSRGDMDWGDFAAAKTSGEHTAATNSGKLDESQAVAATTA